MDDLPGYPQLDTGARAGGRGHGDAAADLPQPGDERLLGTEARRSTSGVEAGARVADHEPDAAAVAVEADHGPVDAGVPDHVAERRSGGPAQRSAAIRTGLGQTGGHHQFGTQPLPAELLDDPGEFGHDAAAP